MCELTPLPLLSPRCVCSYLLGFYFWLDALATLSLIPDIGWIWSEIVKDVRFPRLPSAVSLPRLTLHCARFLLLSGQQPGRHRRRQGRPGVPCRYPGRPHRPHRAVGAVDSDCEAVQGAGKAVDLPAHVFLCSHSALHPCLQHVRGEEAHKQEQELLGDHVDGQIDGDMGQDDEMPSHVNDVEAPPVADAPREVDEPSAVGVFQNYRISCFV